MFRFQICSYLGLSLWILLSSPQLLSADVAVDFQSEVLPMVGLIDDDRVFANVKFVNLSQQLTDHFIHG